MRPLQTPLSTDIRHVGTRAEAFARQSVLGIAIADLTAEEAVDILTERLRQARFTRLAFCNAHTANLGWRDAEYRTCLAQFLVFADGAGVDLAAKLQSGSPFKANLNGTDFVPAFLSQHQGTLRIALIGGRSGIAERAADALRTLAPHHRYSVIGHGYQSADEQEQTLSALADNPVDILLVAMGNPLQERWIADRLSASHTTVAIGVGALFDFLAGAVPRAPVWMRRARLEWVYRLIQEPRRLFSRYIIGNPLFLTRVLMVRSGLWTVR